MEDQIDMLAPRTMESDSVRSVFISDTHLGNYYAQTDRLLTFLSRVRPEFVYLVGDFIDGWELRRRWRWTPEFTRILQTLKELKRRGVRIRYAVGNHDDFLRENPLLTEFLDLSGVELSEEFVHETHDGRNFMVIHGDRFDEYSECSFFFDRVSTIFYNVLLTGNNIWHRSFGGRYGIVSSRVKRSIASIRRHVDRFRQLVVDHARERGCDGVICGHIHEPERSHIDGIEYCNTGDWLENCTAIIEHKDGTMSLQRSDALIAATTVA